MKSVGGIWEFPSENGERLFIKLNNGTYYNAYINKKKEGEKRLPKWEIFIGKKDA